MNGCFVDTSFLLALVLRRDAHSRVATTLLATLPGRFITTDYVLVETANGLCSAVLRPLVQPIIRLMREEPRIQIVQASQRLLDAGLWLFQERPDKGWSFTDCISFVVMREHDMTDALTSDHHFAQAGFKALLRS